MEEAFCKFCGLLLTMRYPGSGMTENGTWNDGFDCAENGPAGLRCRIAAHGGPIDWDETAVAESTTIDDYLSKIACGQRDYAEAPSIPQAIQDAAKEILDWQAAEYKRMDKETEAYFAKYPEESREGLDRDGFDKTGC